MKIVLRYQSLILMNLFAFIFILMACADSDAGTEQVTHNNEIENELVTPVEEKIMENDSIDLLERSKQYIQALNQNVSDPLLIVEIGSQYMFLIKGDEVVDSFIISSAYKGVGSLSGSDKTPLGLHRVCELYGDDLPEGAILKGRAFTGKVAKIYTDSTDVEEDHVTTRILRLEGMEPGKNKGGNVDSYDRYIYIHGTPEEGLLGEPHSHGCIRMKNARVIELYDQIPVGTLVLILE